MATALVSETLEGDKLYQQRARMALPLLIRQAHAGEPITYENLAAELGMPNPRNLNYVLGCIGQSMIAVEKSWGTEVPPIQCLVVNKNTGLPGEGISEFLGNLSSYSKLSKRQRRLIVDTELAKIYSFPSWHKILTLFDLSPAASDFTKLIHKAQNFRGGGESKAHKALKEYVASNPKKIGLKGEAIGQQEYRLPSGDSIDVLFEFRTEYVAIEVKPASSKDADLTRGIYQCVKYQAVLEAMQRTTDKKINLRTILVIAGELSSSLIALKNILGVEVIENVTCPDTLDVAPG
ncbi:hypothetical protein BFS14_23965 [Serratia fonticola]|uniref:hypothetical protein n=1 Tax=Serratia fonticola TaxID=47917 RepID=UPI0008FD35B6|nr:hypothetical protein [Serratia fonticola]OIX91207.1 hypothetical protein BFS14_23965 [Serratia fonticola]QCR59125.1 hypothetical protein FD644_01650 [Serratia fonticola]